jgi:hypothetical protein
MMVAGVITGNPAFFALFKRLSSDRLSIARLDSLSGLRLTICDGMA